MKRKHFERHFTDRIGWLRAAVLGANDGIISTSSLTVGVAAAGVERSAILLAAIAGMVAGAMSMAAGEYVSVSSQSDTEQADLLREKNELATNEAAEREELARIYMGRGLDASLAREVAKQLMNYDALGAHARDELGLSDTHRARPIQAALASAATFAVGASLPVMLVLVTPIVHISTIVATFSLLFLVLLGSIAAKVGGAPIVPGAARVGFWGALAMALTALAGTFFGTGF